MDLSRLLLTEGGRATACGRVVAVAGETWFEPPLPERLVMHAPGREPAPRPSGLGVRVEGVDSGSLDDRREKDGSLEGWACLTGRWHGDRLVIDEQGPWQAREAGPTPLWEVPPCDPPPGGWPIGDVSEQLRERLDGPEVVGVTLFHPSSRQEVAVGASDDPALTRSRLEHLAEGRLCVVVSRHTRDQVVAVRSELDAHFEEWGLYGCGEGRDASGQTLLHTQVVRVLPGLVELAEGVPDGLLVVEAWLTPSSEAG